MFKKIFFLVLISYLLSLISAIPVSAQTADLNIGVSPPLTHVIIQPGKKALTTITVENQGLFDTQITPNFVDFSSDNTSGIPVLSDTMSFPYILLKDDVAQLNKSFLLKTGQKKQLLFEIDLPETSLEKEHHFSLTLGVEPVQNTLHDSSQTSVQGTVVSNFIVTVSKSAQDQGIIQLKSFESSLFLDSLSAIKAKIFVENVGKNTTVTLGEFKITNMLGSVVYQNEILPQNILPNSVRQVFGSEKVSKDGEDFEVELPFRYKPLFLIGPYKISFTYHSPGQESQTFEHTVFALPVSILMFIVIAYILYLIYTKTKLFSSPGKHTSDSEV